MKVLLKIFFDYNPSTSGENWVNRKSQKLEKIVKPKNFVRCCYWWWCWFILNSSHVRFLSTTYTYHRTLNSLRTQFNTKKTWQNEVQKSSLTKLCFSLWRALSNFFMSTHWRTCLRYKVGIKWQNFVNIIHKKFIQFLLYHKLGKIATYCIDNNRLYYLY